MLHAHPPCVITKRVTTHTGFDFDVLVGGHLSRTGNKQDVQILIDFMHDVMAGAEAGLSAVPLSAVVAGTGIQDSTNANFGNSWCVLVRSGWGMNDKRYK